jgi:DNA-directed RNA polymerase specialized sigma24 family protein
MEPDSFVEKVFGAAAKLYPDGVPEPPRWFPVDVLEGLAPATALLVQMTAIDLSERRIPPPLWQVGWSLTWLGIGLETGDEKQIDFSIDHLLGTSGRGRLHNRMEELGLDRAGLHHELRILCVEMIYDFAKRRAWVDDSAKAYGYVRNAFRNRLESRLDKLVDERNAQQSGVPFQSSSAEGDKDRAAEREAGHNVNPIVDPAAPEGRSGLPVEEALTLQFLLRKADDLTKREEEALILRYVEGLEGEALGEALGTKPATARVHLHNAIKKIKKFT